MALWCEILTSGPSGFGPALCSIVGGALLAQSEQPDLAEQVLTQIWLWGRVALGLGLVIFVHELGHFLAAKMFGVKVEKFYVGFDVPIRIGPIRFPRTLGKFRWGETEYGIGIIPLGGYVKMLGQDDDPRKAEEEAKRIRQQSGEADEPPALDPRSYPAKSVVQRMVIISAGVVMNVLTGILFAALAFGMGVTYTPAVIGGLSPGDPAWQAGIEPGGKVISAGEIVGDQKLHFRDMTFSILKHGMSSPEQPISLEIEYADGVRKYALQTAADPQLPERRLIGISPAVSAKINPALIALPHSAAASVLQPEDAGADIVAVDGQPVPVDPIVGLPLSDSVEQRLLADHGASVSLTLRRTGGTEREVVIPPQPMKTLGIAFGVGPISALVAGGPAAEAGLKVGDRIIAVDGQSELSAFGLPARLAGRSAPVEVTVQRGSGEEAEQLTVQVEPRATTPSGTTGASTTGQIAVDPLGLAYRASPVVTASAVDGLQAGDIVRSVTARWEDGVPPADLVEVMSEEQLEVLATGWEITPAAPLAQLVQVLQFLPEGTRLRIIADRPPTDEVIDQTVVLQTDSNQYWPDRGLVFAPVQRVHQATSLSEAWSLGLREGQRRLTEVFQFLKLLVTGKVSRRHVGGPIKIVELAGMEAEQGWSRHLLFLTMLSMNLAILNFLPIPALDGGHMMFLTAEAVLGRPVDERLQMQLTMAGVLALFSLMIFVMINDVATML